MLTEHLNPVAHISAIPQKTILRLVSRPTVNVKPKKKRKAEPLPVDTTPEQLAKCLADRRPSVCRLAEPAFQSLWDAGEFFALDDLLRDVRAVMLRIVPGPYVRIKVRAQLHRMMQRITGGKHHGFEHCLRDRQQDRVEWWNPPEKPPKKPPQSPEYLPTPEQIAEECRRIQAGWSEEERVYRQHAMPGELSGPKRGKRTCQKCGGSFMGNPGKCRCNGCDREHRRRYHRDKQRARRKAVAR